MEILILGIGDAFTRRHFGSSALVRASPDAYVLIDCPDPIHRVLNQAVSACGWNVDASSIDDIVITHLHGDHCNGLESFGFLRRILRMRNPAAVRPRLHVSRPVAERLWERLGPAMSAPMGESRPSELHDFFDLHVLDPATSASVAGLTIHCRFTRHSVPTIGLLISDGSRTVGWSADTPFESAHIEWLNQADLVVHESNLGPSHTPIESLNGLPDSIRRKIRLIHLPDDFETAKTDMRILQAGEVI